jgi:hypothetical protein
MMTKTASSDAITIVARAYWDGKAEGGEKKKPRTAVRRGWGTLGSLGYLQAHSDKETLTPLARAVIKRGATGVTK